MNRWLARALIVILGCAAYSNSLHGPFIFDDEASLTQNPGIKGLFAHQRPDQILNSISARPVALFTFQLNYVVGGLDPFGYHVVNLLIHLGSGLLLLEIIRLNLGDDAVWGDRFRNSANWLAAAVAAVWIVHPLNTESVTYTVERTESLAGFFYLATIYCLILTAKSERFSANFAVLTIVVCALGMGSKETMVSAPIAALLYDRTFLALSFRDALRKRRWLYAGLVSTWVVIGISIYIDRKEVPSGTYGGISSLEYFRSELDVIAYYVRLVFWPHPLCVDYFDWPVSRTWNAVGVGGSLVALSIVATPWLLWKKPWLGFLAAWFFMILAPSSSFVPCSTEIAAERRMYLPMISLAAPVIIGAWLLLRRYRLGSLAALTLLFSIVISLGVLSFARNDLYASGIGIFRDAVKTRPNNSRALLNLANSALVVSMMLPDNSPMAIELASECADAFHRAIQINLSQPGMDYDNVNAWEQWGATLERAHRWADAEVVYTECISNIPSDRSTAFRQRGWLRARRGDFADAMSDYRTSIDLNPSDARTHLFLGEALEAINDRGGAATEYQRALAVNPAMQDAKRRLASMADNPS